MDEIERIEVNETEIAPFLPEIYRKLDWLTKEDLIKRVVSREFGRFLNYYANAPEIEIPVERGHADKAERPGRRERGGRGPKQAEEGYARLFINLGKRDNFYAREIISLVNRYVKGKIEIGRIDLTANCSFFEVPEEDAPLVLKKMQKARVGDRSVVVDRADRKNAAPKTRAERKPRKAARKAPQKAAGKDDWKQFFKHD